MLRQAVLALASPSEPASHCGPRGAVRASQSRVQRFRGQCELGASTALVLALASCAGACGQARHGEPSARGDEAGAAPGGSSAGGASGGGTGGAGGVLMLGGIGAAGTAALDPIVPVPLADTQQCDNEFVRVAQLPDIPLFITGAIDGEPTEIQSGADDAGLPTIGIFRFGSLAVENIGLPFLLSPRGYSGAVNVSAVDCDVYGNLSEMMMPPVFSIDAGTFRSTTYSIDGYEGITIGKLHAEWSNDAGEQHVLDASFALPATMPDARRLD